MTRIYTQTHIRQPIEKVFDYVTTPGNWPQWHPSSLAVSGATDHSLTVGEQVTEEFLVAGRAGKVVWTVKEHLPPRRWMIAGQIVGREGGGIITYNLTSENSGTKFEREFVYPPPNWLFWLLDWLYFRHRVLAESQEALHQLKEKLAS